MGESHEVEKNSLGLLLQISVLLRGRSGQDTVVEFKPSSQSHSQDVIMTQAPADSAVILTCYLMCGHKAFLSSYLKLPLQELPIPSSAQRASYCHTEERFLITLMHI